MVPLIDPLIWRRVFYLLHYLLIYVAEYLLFYMHTVTWAPSNIAHSLLYLRYNSLMHLHSIFLYIRLLYSRRDLLTCRLS